MSACFKDVAEAVREQIILAISAKNFLVVCDTCGPTNDPVRWWGSEALCERCFRAGRHGEIDYRSKTARDTRIAISQLIKDLDFDYLAARFASKASE